METDLKVLENWIYKELRIDISAYKSNQMNRRLLSLMARNGAESANRFISMLEKDQGLKQKLTDFITINVSEFFRNKELFLDFENKIKELIGKGEKRLRIWSAACSNGAEPYSIALMLDRLTPEIRHTIIGTDIDATILETARKGEYVLGDIKNIDKSVLQKYFVSSGSKYILNQDIRNRVQFKKHDLILDTYDKGFDIIICRNVVIYFTQEVKDKIYRKFFESLNKEGLLFVGATESIYNYKDFGLDKASTFIYQKRI